jgi:tRNA C32,U32 (ribose-2'-O)-methylase TrmJ
MTSLVRIVLIDPRHPGNIGSVARAMKNMALDDLVLVRPRGRCAAQGSRGRQRRGGHR